MYAITIQEPYATLIRNGYKHFETRSWKAPKKYYGKTFYIHAAKKDFPHWKDNPNLKEFLSMELNNSYVVAKATLVECIPTEFAKRIITPMEKKLGFYEDGRYAWVFDDIVPCTRFYAKGRLGIWEV